MFTKYHEQQINNSWLKYKDTKFPDMWESLGHTYFKEHIGTDIVKYAAWVKDYKTRYAVLTKEIRADKRLAAQHSKALNAGTCGCNHNTYPYVYCEDAKKTWGVRWKRSEARSLWLMRNVGKKYYHKQEWQHVVLQRPVV